MRGGKSGYEAMGWIMSEQSQKRWSIPSLSSILHQNNRPNTSNLWLLTFFPFLFHTIFGRGSPVAWQMKDATPPCTPVWSLGVLKNFGGAANRAEDHIKQLASMLSLVDGEINLSYRAKRWKVADFGTWLLRGLTLEVQTIGCNDFYCAQLKSVVGIS